MSADRIVAVGLLTRRDVDLLGPTFQRLWPIEDVSCFVQLLQAIDDADCQLATDRDSSGEPETV